ncbi:hypothetical protein AHMF7605_07455 [Adhaeribacter arboris]|uniref:Uncharacterized protein n=1 Tax=Adhaeribacter arboris TaxID=2072846 RepID=A0A2T2YCZ6_9BACT|nr:GNAT family N-acetyltransferase [Adhaeribacter arboris]PSR53374.1 hypothetical protein AHMF7605_07455 [Adhaeribacter arboris]
MWKRLSSSRINKGYWDACVQSDPAGLVYALSWYLDAVAPAWEGWVKEENEQYTAVIPIVKRKIAGIPVITQPLLTQQLGLFTRDHSFSSAKPWQELLPAVFKSSTATEQYSFNSGNYQNLKYLLPLKERINLILPLASGYNTLKAAFRLNRIRDLQKAAATQLQVQTGNKLWPQVFELYQANVFPRLNKKHQLILKKIIPKLIEAATVRGCGLTFTVTLPSGQIVAGAFFIRHQNRLTYLLPAASEVGKKCGASTFLLDQVCQQFAGSKVILDFEGSAHSGIALFYKSFGAQCEGYGLLENYNFSLPLKLLYSLKGWLNKFNLPR